jgi:hypothetical protein
MEGKFSKEMKIMEKYPGKNNKYENLKKSNKNHNRIYLFYYYYIILLADKIKQGKENQR